MCGLFCARCLSQVQFLRASILNSLGNLGCPRDKELQGVASPLSLVTRLQIGKLFRGMNRAHAQV